MGQPNAKPRVLIIDNANTVVSVVKPYLQQHGFAVAHVRSHTEALGLLNRGVMPDVILNDAFTQCGLTGEAFLKQKHNKGVPTIAFANSQADNMAMVHVGACDEYEKNALVTAIHSSGELAVRFIESVTQAVASKSLAR